MDDALTIKVYLWARAREEPKINGRGLPSPLILAFPQININGQREVYYFHYIINGPKKIVKICENFPRERQRGPEFVTLSRAQ